ncbi:hypothetical protein [Salinibaculum rarum]|uniref:hypothetical protein n=1 Tax=Salinibaculum rarum TaxID=3058903 RepID=UPI00265E9911|nr:hypothetical protein [Salinibaculum sp. KK48]
MTETLNVLIRVEQSIPEDEHEAYLKDTATAFPEKLLDEHLFHITCEKIAAYGTNEATKIINTALETAVTNLEPELEDLKDRLTGDESTAELLDDWDFRYACHLISGTETNRYGLYDGTDHSRQRPVVTWDTVEDIVTDRVGPVYVVQLSFDR